MEVTDSMGDGDAGGLEDAPGSASLGSGRTIAQAIDPRLPVWAERMVRDGARAQAVISRLPSAPGGQAQVDWARTFRRWARAGRPSLRVDFLPRYRKPGPVCVLWDVSGSMAGYIPLYFPWIYAMAQLIPRFGVFPFGTELVEISRGLAGPYRRAIQSLATQTSVWGSGTAFGAVLERWMGEFGRMWLGPHTTMIIMSDGWDAGDPAQFQRTLLQIAGTVQRILWVNPLMATPGFEPKTRALRIAGRFVDAMVPGHNPEALLEIQSRLK